MMNLFSTKTAQVVQPYVLLLVRVVTGYIFLLHGTAKFFEFPVSMTGGQGAVPLFSLFGIGGLMEIVGGVLLALGWLVRPTAFILSGMMAVAYFMFHAGSGVWLDPITNQGEAAALFCMAFLMLWVSGAGRFSLDALSAHN